MISSHPNALDLPSRPPLPPAQPLRLEEACVGQGGQDDDRRDDQSAAPSTGMLVALAWGDMGKSQPPRGPPGGRGDDGDPD
eukprot:9477227-Pyramimonas_sp.AAC.1